MRRVPVTSVGMILMSTYFISVTTVGQHDASLCLVSDRCDPVKIRDITLMACLRNSSQWGELSCYIR